MADISELIGKVPIKVRIDNKCDIYIKTEDGSNFRFIHHQDCCESVWIEDMEGDLDSMIGNPILVAEERSCDRGPLDYCDERYRWTFYTLATIAGHIDIRWYGTSNGYYSERVDFEKYETDVSKHSWRGGWC